MSTPIMFPDIEAWAISKLRPAIPPVAVDIKVPQVRPASFVSVRHDAGRRLDGPLKAGRLGVRVFGPTEEAATDLAARVESVLSASADGDPVVLIETTSGPSVVPDEIPTRYLVLNLIYRGSPLA